MEGWDFRFKRGNHSIPITMRYERMQVSAKLLFPIFAMHITQNLKTIHRVLNNLQKKNIIDFQFHEKKKRSTSFFLSLNENGIV